jgi:hypothetical protein
VCFSCLFAGTALAGILAVLVAGGLDMKATLAGKQHYLLYCLTPAMKPRMLMTGGCWGAGGRCWMRLLAGCGWLLGGLVVCIMRSCMLHVYCAPLHLHSMPSAISRVLWEQCLPGGDAQIT